MLFLPAASIASLLLAADPVGKSSAVDGPLASAETSPRASAATAIACDVDFVPLSFDVQFDGPGVFSKVLPLGCSRSLDGVTEIIVDALRLQFTTFGDGEFSISTELLSGQTEVASGMSTLVGFHVGSSLSSDRRARPLLTIPIALPFGSTFDAVRLTFTCTNSVTSLRCRGMHPNNVARFALVRGLDAAGCHATQVVAGLPVQQIQDAGITPWVTSMFAAPVPMSTVRLAYVPMFSFSTMEILPPGTSSTIESELLLSNGSTLRLDNWQSPGVSFAASPEASIASVRGESLIIGSDVHAALQGVLATGWRYRLHKTGTGAFTATPPTTAKLRFLHSSFYPSADLDGDGIVGATDLAIMLGAWGVCSPCGACVGDINVDGFVDGIDVSVLLGAWST